MKKINKKSNKKIYLIILACLIILIVISVGIKDDRKLLSYERFIKDTFYSIVNQKKDYKTITNDNNLTIQNKELVNQIEELKKLLNLNTSLALYDIVNASIVSRDIGYWYNTFVIDKGKLDGIDYNMAVVNSDGLVGKVIKLTNNTSTIKLLTSSVIDNKISIKIDNNGNYIYGLLTKYDSKNNVFIIEGISENADIINGSLVLTSGLSEIFPSGLLIGKVKNTTTDNFDLAKTIEVTPSVNFNDLYYVAVLKREK